MDPITNMMQVWAQRLQDLTRMKGGEQGVKLSPTPYTVEEEDALEKLRQAMLAGGGTGIGQLTPEISFLQKLLRLGPKEAISGHMEPGAPYQNPAEWDQIKASLSGLSERKRLIDEAW